HGADGPDPGPPLPPRSARRRALQRQRLRGELLPRQVVRGLAPERLAQLAEEAGGEPRSLGGPPRRGGAPRRDVAQGGRPQRPRPERPRRRPGPRGRPQALSRATSSWWRG